MQRENYSVPFYVDMLEAVDFRWGAVFIQLTSRLCMSQPSSTATQHTPLQRHCATAMRYSWMLPWLPPEGSERLTAALWLRRCGRWRPRPAAVAGRPGRWRACTARSWAC